MRPPGSLARRQARRGSVPATGEARVGWRRWRRIEGRRRRAGGARDGRRRAHRSLPRPRAPLTPRRSTHGRGARGSAPGGWDRTGGRGAPPPQESAEAVGEVDAMAGADERLGAEGQCRPRIRAGPGGQRPIERERPRPDEKTRAHARTADLNDARIRSAREQQCGHRPLPGACLGRKPGSVVLVRLQGQVLAGYSVAAERCSGPAGARAPVARPNLTKARLRGTLF